MHPWNQRIFGAPHAAERTSATDDLVAHLFQDALPLQRLE
jgi:hypothetical protein